jgi:hypothetical protein
MILPRAFRANEGGRMGMEVQENTEAVVDTYGLPDYKVTKLLGEIDPDGHDIRLICGQTRFRQLTWLYTVTLSPEDLLTFSRYCERLALEAFNTRELMGKKRMEGAH